jgi:hypothetical protein
LVDNYYTYIECNKDDSFDIESFPTIYFENKEFETIFNLTYKDLFVLDDANNKYILLILYSSLSNNWIFGSIFLRKYQFTFSVDSKKIGYYKSMNNYKRNEENNNNQDSNEKGKDDKENNNSNDNKQKGDDDKKNINGNNNNNQRSQVTFYIIIGILFVIFCALFLIFGMYIQKKCVNSKRKKRFNELEDENFDFYGNDKSKDLINPKKNRKFEENQDVYNDIEHNIN